MKLNLFKFFILLTPLAKEVLNSVKKSSDGGRKITRAEGAAIKAAFLAALDDLIDDDLQNLL